MNKKVLITYFVVLFLLSSCDSSSTDINTSYPTITQSTKIGIAVAYPSISENTLPSPENIPSSPTDAPEPNTGFGSISGTLYSFTTNITLAKTYYYLLVGDGPNKDKMPPILIGPKEGDIQGITDENGQFFINNIPPGNYFLIVESPYNYSPVVTSKSDFTPLLLTIKENNKYPLGVVFVSWP